MVLADLQLAKAQAAADDLVAQGLEARSVELDVTDDILLFASYREGYKGFGFDARSNNNTSFGFDDEEVSSYEVGLRASLPGNRASFGLTLYRSTYSDLQISQFDGTVGFNVGNAGRTRSQGVEANARYAIAPGIVRTGRLGR